MESFTEDIEKARRRSNNSGARFADQSAFRMTFTNTTLLTREKERQRVKLVADLFTGYDLDQVPKTFDRGVHHAELVLRLRT